MNIKDIVNRDIVNLTNCDHEPIHVPGSIQPHGFLIAFSEDLTIEFCSANIESLLGLPPARILKQSLVSVFPNTISGSISEYLQTRDNSPLPLHLELNQKNFYVSIHQSKDLWIAELEPVTSEMPRASAVYEQTVRFIKFMEESQTLQQLCDRVASEVRTLTGYDRVMIYRFDKNYNGEVFAESKREDLESFFGLHYPHTDIPVQARQLYLVNLLRLIVDVNYEPVPLLTVDDKPGKNLDLSLSGLRSVSPIHIQYLQNMGVGATLTISLIHNDRLWGLISCHHYSKKHINHYAKIIAQLQGHLLTSQIDMRQKAEEYSVANTVNEALEILHNHIFLPDRASLSAIVQHPQLLQICNAAGVCILLHGVIYKHGLTPADNTIRSIADWAFATHKQSVFSSSKLIDEFTELSDCSAGAGVIFCALSTDNAACIIWFNPETLEEVKWGGNPEKAIIKDENGLHPRKSFETWKQVVKCQAREWVQPELTAATNFAYTLQKHITLLLLKEEETRQRLLSEELKASNAELENINWLSTHDLKEPLRKIQMFTSKLMDTEGLLPGNINTTLEKLNASARRMQKLIADLTNYSKIRKTGGHVETIELNEVVKQLTEAFADDFNEKNIQLSVQEGLPVIKGVPVLVQELLNNLLRNAVKFSRPEAGPFINISASVEQHTFETDAVAKAYHVIAVKDNGIGFDNNFAEDIFKIFSRLHNAAQYEGSGIGLASCKKIMQIHHGHIRAEGKPNESATFYLYFPVEDASAA